MNPTACNQRIVSKARPVYFLARAVQFVSILFACSVCHVSPFIRSGSLFLVLLRVLHLRRCHLRQAFTDQQSVMPFQQWNKRLKTQGGLGALRLLLSAPHPVRERSLVKFLFFFSKTKVGENFDPL
jgi:hypothetical protein